ncbi:MAG: hypothetical protein M0Q94_05240 [Candidatus Cloacimonetes bacterium]|nr:hypothetical protein [Candidatus Cloacimonadota bacterium]
MKILIENGVLIMYNKKFKEICTSYYGSCNTDLPCEDEFICIIDMENESFLEGYDIIQTDEAGKKRNQTIKDKILNYECKVIALVLESPHTSEYNQCTPLGPGLGKTGKNIHDHIIEILKNSNLQLVA